MKFKILNWLALFAILILVLVRPNVLVGVWNLFLEFWWEVLIAVLLFLLLIWLVVKKYPIPEKARKK